MNIELLSFGLGCGVAGIIVGLVVANIFRADSGSFKKVKAELEEAQEKLKQQAEHFAESENMLHKLGSDLKDLYQHMSKNEISTLKEKFKGLVIDADTHLDELAHKEEKTEEAIDEVIEELVAPLEKTEAVAEEVESTVATTTEEAETKVEAAEEEVAKDDETTESTAETTTEEVEVTEVDVAKDGETAEPTAETSDEIKEKINETIDELAEKKKNS